MKLIQLDVAGMMTFHEFLKEGLDAVCKTCQQGWNLKFFMYFLAEGVESGKVGVWIEMGEQDNPIGLFVLVHDQPQSVEFTVVYNYPTAHPKEALETVGVPWAKAKGARLLRAFDPMDTPVSARRLRRYGFEKVGEENGSIVYQRNL